MPNWSGGRIRGTGYHPDAPDKRDFCRENLKERLSPQGLKSIEEQLEHFFTKKKLPLRKNIGNDNLSLWPVEDQGPFQSCTAHAVIGMVEFLLRKADAKRRALHVKSKADLASEIQINLSRFFLYKATRKLLGWTGDKGACLRTTIQALALFGAPPEEYWPYSAGNLDAEPTPFIYSYAQAFKAMVYMRLDSDGATGADTLDKVKRVLADDFPVVFGFPLYRSVTLMKKGKPESKENKPPADADSEWPWVIPPPNAYPYDSVIGGHAVLAVGYDDNVTFTSPFDGSVVGKPGALIIRNSWGYGWGDRGFAYIPYSYVTDQLASDFWTIFSQSNFSQRPFQ